MPRIKMGHIHKSGLRLLGIFVTCSILVTMVTGTGTLLDPPSRGAMWKEGFKTETNYNYMQQNCGGVKQNELGTRQCGVCGDPVDSARPHELGQKYGSGTISRYFDAGVKEIRIRVELQAFEKGFFEFRICPANNKSVTQECLNQNLLPIKEGYFAGMPMRYYPNKAGDFRLTVAVPPNMTCDRCVIQWRYRTANSWGVDPGDKTEGMGKGPQEEFYNCADIRIGGEMPVSVRNYAPPLTVTDVRQDQSQTWTASASGSFDQSAIAGSNIPPSIIPPITVTGDLTSGQTQTTSIDSSLFDVQTPQIVDMQNPAMVGILDPTIVTLQDRIRADLSMTGHGASTGVRNPMMVGIQEPTIIGLQNRTISEMSVINIQHSSTGGSSGNAVTNTQGQTVVGESNPTIVSLPDPIVMDSSITGGSTFIDTQGSTGTVDSTFIDSQATSGAADSTFIDSQATTGAVDSTFINSQGTAGAMDSTFVNSQGTVGAMDSTSFTSQGTAMTGSQDQTVIDVQTPTLVGVQDTIVRDSQTATGFDTRAAVASDPTVVGFQDLSVVPLINPMVGVSDPMGIPGPASVPLIVGVQDSTSIQGSSMTGIQDASVVNVQENPTAGLQDSTVLATQDHTIFGSATATGTVAGRTDPAIVGIQGNTVFHADGSTGEIVGQTDPIIVGMQSDTMFGTAVSTGEAVGQPDPTIVGMQDNTIIDTVGSIGEMVVQQDPTIVDLQSNNAFGTVDSTGTMIGQPDPTIVGIQDQTFTSVDATAADGTSQMINVNQPIVDSSASVIYKDGGATSTTVDRIGSTQNVITTDVLDGTVANVDGTSISSGSINVANIDLTADPILSQPSETVFVGLENSFDNNNQLSSSGTITSISQSQNTASLVVDGNRGTGMVVDPLPQPTGMVSGGETVEAKTFIGSSSFPPSQSISQQAINEYMLANMAAAQADLDVVPMGGNPLATLGMTDPSMVVSSMGGVSGGFVDTGAVFPNPPSTIMVHSASGMDASGSNINTGVVFPNPPPPIMVNNVDVMDASAASVTTGVVFPDLPPPIMVNNVDVIDASVSNINAGAVLPSLPPPIMDNIVGVMDVSASGINTVAVLPGTPPPIMVNNVGVMDASVSNINTGAVLPIAPPPPIMANNVDIMDVSASNINTGAAIASAPPPPIMVNSLGTMDMSGSNMEQVGSITTGQISSNVPSMTIKATGIPGTIVDTVSQGASVGTVSQGASVGTVTTEIKTIGTISNSNQNMAATIDQASLNLPGSIDTSIVSVAEQVPASQPPPIVPVIPTMKSTVSVQTDITNNQGFVNVPIVGPGGTAQVMAGDGVITTRKSIKDPFEHIPAQSLAVIPMEADANAVKIDIIADKGTTVTKDVSSQAVKTSGAQLNINLNVPVDKVPMPSSILTGRDPIASKSNIISTSQTIKSGSNSGISSNIVDLRNVQTNTGISNTNINTLSGGETLKANIELQPDKVKNGDIVNNIPKVDILGSDITILSSGKQFLGQGSRNNRNVTISRTSPPPQQRERFRFIVDPRTGMMRRVPITSELDGQRTNGRAPAGRQTGTSRSEMDVLRRISSPRNGQLPPEYFLEGAGRRGSGFQGFVPGQFAGSTGVQGQTAGSSGIFSRLFGDVSGRRPVFPFGMGGGQSQVPLVMGPGMVRSGLGFSRPATIDTRGGQNAAVAATGTASGDSRGVVRSTGVVGATDGARATGGTRITSGTGIRSPGTGTGVQRVLRPDSAVGTRGDTRRGTTALFLRPDTRPGPVPSTGTAGFTGGRTPAFGGFPGMAGVAGAPFMGAPTMGRGMGGTMGGGIGGVPPVMGMTGGGGFGGFGARGFEGLRALDIDGLGGDFFPRTFRTFRGGVPGASPFSPLMSLDGLM